MDIEAFMEKMPEGLQQDESLILINGADSSGAILTVCRGEYKVIPSSNNVVIHRLDGPKTPEQLAKWLRDNSWALL